MFEVLDTRAIFVSLTGVENLLEIGKSNFVNEAKHNPFADLIEKCGGVDLLERLQEHENEKIFQKA